LTNHLNTAVSPHIIAPDSMKLKYRISGVQHRKPRRHFWTTTDFEYIDAPDDNTMRSKETIHWTVDVITSMDAYPPCKALMSSFPEEGSKTNCRCEVANKRHRRHWKLPLKKSKTIQNYRVCEETTSDGNQTAGVDVNLELKLLTKWLDSELKSLQKNGGERGPNPQTCITEVMDAIQRRFWGSVTGS
jgi:hypothetical protein